MADRGLGPQHADDGAELGGIVSRVLFSYVVRSPIPEIWMKGRRSGAKGDVHIPPECVDAYRVLAGRMRPRCLGVMRSVTMVRCETSWVDFSATSRHCSCPEGGVS